MRFIDSVGHSLPTIIIQLGAISTGQTTNSPIQAMSEGLRDFGRGIARSA